MAKRNTGTTAIPPANEFEEVAPSNGDAPSKRARKTFPHVLEELILGAEVTVSEVEKRILPAAYCRVTDSPNFADSRKAWDWAAENYKGGGELRVIQDKGHAKPKTETVTKTKLAFL